LEKKKNSGPRHRCAVGSKALSTAVSRCHLENKKHDSEDIGQGTSGGQKRATRHSLLKNRWVCKKSDYRERKICERPSKYGEGLQVARAGNDDQVLGRGNVLDLSASRSTLEGKRFGAAGKSLYPSVNWGGVKRRVHISFQERRRSFAAIGESQKKNTSFFYHRKKMIDGLKKQKESTPRRSPIKSIRGNQKAKNSLNDMASLGRQK